MNANPGNTVSYTLNASSLNQGAVTVTVDTTDPNLNPSSFAGTGATKDTVLPVDPTSASVAAGTVRRWRTTAATSPPGSS